MLDRAGASGLTVKDFQDLILVNQVGQRIWNEMDNTYDFLNSARKTTSATLYALVPRAPPANRNLIAWRRRTAASLRMRR
jgi:hypothetical protein